MSDLKITTGGKEYIPNGSKLLAHAFETDPTFTYMLSSMSPKAKKAYEVKCFATLLRLSVMHHGTIDEIDDWKSLGVMLPPGTDLGHFFIVLRSGALNMMWNVGLAGCHKIFYEVDTATLACKKKVLSKGDKHFYIFFLATHSDARGRGLCSRIVKHYQAIATEEGLPIYLEAGTEYACKLYQRLGFVTVDPINLGFGKCDEKGKPCEGGNGVTIWGMIWRPEAKGEGNGS